MELKIKKLTNEKLIRVEAKGEVKEIFIQEDFLNPDSNKFSICFRGQNQSGIVELNSEEINNLYEEIKKNKELIKGGKIIFFESENSERPKKKRGYNKI